MRRLTTIEDTFQIAGRGLVIVPGPLKTDVEGGERTVELRNPYGKVQRATISLSHVMQTPPPSKEIAAQWGCILLGVSKADVPIGTEVWDVKAI